jgi:hypothetical protein
LAKLLKTQRKYFPELRDSDFERGQKHFPARDTGFTPAATVGVVDAPGLVRRAWPTNPASGAGQHYGADLEVLVNPAIAAHPCESSLELVRFG